MMSDAHDEIARLVARLEGALATPPRSLWDGHLEETIAELGELRAVSTIPVIVRACEVSDEVMDIHDVAGAALSNMGAPGIEALLEAHAATRTPTVRHTLDYALAELGVRDERILAVFLAMLRDDPDHAATLLSEYGDPAALPALEEALDRFEIGSNGDGPFANHAVIELAGAIERLGGVVSDEGLVKLGKAKRIGSAAAAQVANALRSRPKVVVERAPRLPTHRSIVVDRPQAPRPKLGRNERCWCGSGRKYKRCHLHVDTGS